MRLSLFRSLWGVTDRSDATLDAFARDGYVGIEATLFDGGPNAGGIEELCRAAQERGLRVAGMAYTDGSDEAAHFESLRRQADRWAALGADRITAHSARDAWPTAQSVDFYGRCVEFERTQPIPIAHETHRGRAFFNPWATRDILNQVSGVRLCCDYSHWVCVAERLLEDCGSILALAAQHCDHVHARVGYEQGPQVPDPSAAEYRPHLDAHGRWWRQIWDANVAAGRDELTVVPEYGPPAYLHTLPHANTPVADLDHVVEWMSGWLRERFG